MWWKILDSVLCWFVAQITNHFSPVTLQAKMGFREGEGLGKFGQGRREIVEASTQRGRRGLGLTLQGFQGELNVDWRDEPEVQKPIRILQKKSVCLYSQYLYLFPHTCVLNPWLCPWLFVQPSAVEKVEWFPECTTEMPDSDELKEWMILGKVTVKTLTGTVVFCIICFFWMCTVLNIFIIWFFFCRESLRLRMRQSFVPKIFFILCWDARLDIFTRLS